MINYFFTKRKIKAYLEYVKVFKRSKIRERVIQVVRYMFLFRGSMFFQITGNGLCMESAVLCARIFRRKIRRNKRELSFD